MKHGSRFRWAIVPALALTVFAGGCRQPRTAQEIQREYALKILGGFSVGYSDVRAERADPATNILYNLTLQTGDTLIHADSAEILVDASHDSISLQLRGVVGADAKTGLVTPMEDLRTKPFKLAGSVRD